MIDTIKVGIPLSEGQLAKLLNQVQTKSDWQWVQWHPQSGDMRFMRFRGLAETDQNSYHRYLYWDIPDHYTIPDLDGNPRTFLTIELSLPKFTYGHNCRLLYGWVDSIKDLKKQLQHRLHCRLPDVMDWQVKRLDPCYAWLAPSQETAQGLLESLKRLRYPRKVPTIEETGIIFKGNTYSLKVYLKLPEFRVHDMRELIKSKASLNWVDHIEKIAGGVIRFEATLRQKYLQRMGIRTVADLVSPMVITQWHFDGDLEVKEIYPQAVMGAIWKHHGYFKGSFRETLLDMSNPFRNAAEKRGLSAPAMDIDLPDGKVFHFPGGGYTVKEQDKCTTLLQNFLEKFIGKNKGMDKPGQVKEKLFAEYKGEKATRLLGFWLYVQRFGIADAKATFTKPTFYRNKADLKAVGINFVEADLVTTLDSRFVESFKFEVPSLHVVNKVDDYKDHGNLLNERTHAENQS